MNAKADYESLHFGDIVVWTSKWAESQAPKLFNLLKVWRWQLKKEYLLLGRSHVINYFKTLALLAKHSYQDYKSLFWQTRLPRNNKFSFQATKEGKLKINVSLSLYSILALLWKLNYVWQVREASAISFYKDLVTTFGPPTHKVYDFEIIFC